MARHLTGLLDYMPHSDTRNEISRFTSELLSSHSRWLELADIALALDAAREEQEKIKQTIRPSVEKYKRMRDCSK
ncbi:MAG: hypothetical protein DMG68_10670 [Acidobacteria bacterium]|nr:MAG: hypothetical protein DMG68_10670 [Acidobacteriota bacterium]